MFVFNKLLILLSPIVKARTVWSFSICGLNDFFQSNTRYGLLFSVKASKIFKAKVVLPAPDIPVIQICLGQSFSLNLKGNSFLPEYETVARLYVPSSTPSLGGSSNTPLSSNLLRFF